MSFGFDEPIPEVPAAPSFKPVWIALVCGIAVSFAIDIPTNSVWGLLAYLPCWAILGRVMIRVVRKHRQFDRDLDDWHDRMIAYYRRPIR